MDARTLPAVRMPNRDGFVRFSRGQRFCLQSDCADGTGTDGWIGDRVLQDAAVSPWPPAIQDGPVVLRYPIYQMWAATRVG
jgi:hypothetical protein